MGSISLTIDGRTVEVEEGTTVLQAAREAGITIPTICDHKDLNPYGACRMCIVEIEGVRGFPTSCTTPATPGMQVDHPVGTADQLAQPHPGADVFRASQQLSGLHPPRGLRAVPAQGHQGGAFHPLRLLRQPRRMRSADHGPERGQAMNCSLPTLYASYNLERDDPFMDRDYNLCVLCGKCWRICEKIHGKPAISIINRGKWARIGTAFDKSHVYSGCTFCGACIDICPTGTLTDRFARWQGKPEADIALYLHPLLRRLFGCRPEQGRPAAGLHHDRFQQRGRAVRPGPFRRRPDRQHPTNA